MKKILNRTAPGKRGNEGEQVPSIIKGALRNDLSEVSSAVAGDEFAVQAVSADGDTALHIAATFGNFSMVSYLVELPHIDLAAKNARGFDPLDVAIETGHPGVKSLLFRKRAEQLGLAGDSEEDQPKGEVLPFKLP